MPLKQSYVVWNNKGGVGKSTIVFTLASSYAEKHPKENVLVVDMCPQANATMMLLGGGSEGEDQLMKLQAASDPATVVGYISDQIGGLTGSVAKAKRYELRVADFNSKLPKNLWLIPGDGNLELIATAISYYANAQFPTDAWQKVHLWIRNLVQSVADSPTPWVVFIDTNPAFAIYTELAILAASRLLVPYKADDSSRVAVRALFHLLWGAIPPHPVYGRYTFAQKAKDAGLELPLCHLFIGNQFKQYAGSAKAFAAMSDAVLDDIFSLFQKSSKRFSQDGVKDKPSFEGKFVFELRDFNTTGVVAAHSGSLLSKLTEGGYDVHGTTVNLDSGRIDDCRKAIDKIVARL